MILCGPSSVHFFLLSIIVISPLLRLTNSNIFYFRFGIYTFCKVQFFRSEAPRILKSVFHPHLKRSAYLADRPRSVSVEIRLHPWISVFYARMRVKNPHRQLQHPRRAPAPNGQRNGREHPRLNLLPSLPQAARPRPAIDERRSLEVGAGPKGMRLA